MVDSFLHPRPKSSTFYRSDTNAGLSAAISTRRHCTSSKFPSLRRQSPSPRAATSSARYTVDSNTIPTPHREDNPLVDPVTGVLSLAVDTRDGSALRWPSRAASARSRATSSMSQGRPRVKSAMPAIGTSSEKSHGSRSPSPPSLRDADQKEEEKRDEDAELRALYRAIANNATYRTSYQDANNDIGWPTRMAPHPRPPSVHETKPDAVHTRLNVERYNASAEDWQTCAPPWDRVQFRQGQYRRGPQAVVFGSVPKESGSLPGYMGHNPTDTKGGTYTSLLQKPIRLEKPRHTTIAHRPNIPGYSGKVLWSATYPVRQNLGSTMVSTSRRVYRKLPLEEPTSPFSRTGVLSKNISLNYPYNPFNKVY
eukprot:m.1247 g.1247  ORF g.1247 m.1247 type:complete len:367 (+) comp5948_c0_seq1:59-1159(+)